MATETNQKSNFSEIDFSVIIAILWQQRKLIIFGILATTLLAVAISFFIPKTYRSEGFYQLGNPERIEKNKDQDQDKSKDKETFSEKKIDFIGITIPLYKKSAPQFSNPNRFYLFASKEKSCSSNDLDKIKNSFRTEGAINKWILPVYAVAKGDIQSPTSGSNSVLGLNLSYEDDSPQKAYKTVCFFGLYIRDCLLYVSLYDYIKEEYSNVVSEVNKNENDIIDLQFKLQQNTKKMLDIKAILTKYPASAKIENRQLVSIQEGGARFLAPITQLVGIESGLADQRQELAKLERKKEKLLIRREFFSKSNDMLNKSSNQGGVIFSQLKSIKYEVFKKMDFQKGTIKEVFNGLNIDLQIFDLAFFTNCRFISGPTVPMRHIKPLKSVIVIVTFFLSVFFFLFLALCLSWWQNHKQAILANVPAAKK